MDKDKTEEVCRLRAQGLYKIDKNMTYRKSHKNPEIKALYDEYLGEPNGEKAHHLLHTHYVKREKIM